MHREAPITLRFGPHGPMVGLEGPRLVLDAALRNGVAIDAPCRGQGTCGRCRVRVVSGDVNDPTDDELAHIPDADIGTGTRLACRCRVLGDAVVEVLGGTKGPERILTEGFVPALVPEPPVSKRPAGDGSTEVVRDGRVVSREPGDTTGVLYGAAVDIGTTTIVASLVDLVAAEERATASAVNPQTVHGLDVMTRIAYASDDPGHVEELASLVRGSVRALIREACVRAGVDSASVYEVVVAGNPAMTHLFLGVDPAPLGVAPHEPAFSGERTEDAATLGLDVAPGARVVCVPGVSAFVGGDIVAGVLATRMAASSETALLVDVGTNGEMVLAHEGRLTAASAAAGPAFEGMGVSCGMRAADGAIERVDMSGAGDVTLGVIGEREPVGACGTGILDAVAGLLAVGLLDASGRLAMPEEAVPALAARLRAEPPRRFVLAGEGEGEVALTQQDVRAVQLAKGAVLAGVLTLLAREGLTAEDVQRVYLAGAFGRHVRPSSVERVGLLPGPCARRLTFVGDTAKTGAMLALVSLAERAEAGRLAETISHVGLVSDETFASTFTSCLDFPSA